MPEDDGFEKHLEALHTLLEIARQHERDGSHASLVIIMRPILNTLTSMYGIFYDWYLGIGAPGGESQEAFNAWLKMVATEKEV